jgi:hypothetical protein
MVQSLHEDKTTKADRGEALVAPVLAAEEATRPLLEPTGSLMGGPLGALFAAGGLTFALGLVLFGASIVRARVLPRWAGVCLIAARRPSRPQRRSAILVPSRRDRNRAVGEGILSEEALIAAASSGDRAAFDRLVAPVHRSLRGFAYRLVAQPDDADAQLSAERFAKSKGQEETELAPIHGSMAEPDFEPSRSTAAPSPC